MTHLFYVIIIFYSVFQIHSFVKSTLVPGVTLQNVYFTGRADVGDFKAVVVLRGEKAIDKTNPQRKMVITLFTSHLFNPTT